MSTLRQFNTPISLSSAALSATHNSNTVANIFTTGGNVGIGTTSPIGVLDAKGTGFWGIIRTIPSSFGGESSIGFISNPDGSVGTGPTTSNWLLGTNINGYPLGQFNIRSNALGTASIFTIATNGNVGIGTTAPGYTLDINGGLEASNSNGLMLFGTSGNVFIGSTTPTPSAFGRGNLMLYGTAATNSGIALDGVCNTTLQFLNSGTMKGALALVATAGNWSTDSRVGDMVIRCASNQSMLFNTNNGSGVATMVISGGNVGIGTTSPSEVLHINNSADCYIRINAGAGDKSGIKMLGGGAGVSSIYQNDLTGDLQFDLDSTNLMTITRNGTIGNVGINTTNPSALLDVANGSDAGGAQGGPQISFQYRTSSGGGFRHFIKTRHNAVSANNNGNGIDFFLNNLNTATGSSAPGTGNICTMSVTALGVGFGTTSPSWPIHVTANNGNYTWPASGYYFTTSTSIASAGAGGASLNNSILAAGGITSSVGFYATSDIRIKKILKQGIREIDISQIDKLDITKFEYIDKLVHGNDAKLGFIAQNVHEFVPEAVTIRKEFVPNIFKVTSVNDKVIELTGHNLTVGTRIKIMIDEQDRNGTVTEVTNIIDENHFCIDHDLDNKDKLFIYGTEVDDFKELNYNHIFTLSVGAVQKLRQDVRHLEDKLSKLDNLDKLVTFIQNKFPNEFIL